MFGPFKKSPPKAPEASQVLLNTVRQQLPEADDESARIVAAIAGLLASVAYADGEFSDEERAMLRRELLRVNGITEQGVDAICAVLHEHIVLVSTTENQRFTRDLRALADRDLRVEVLNLMVELAASDGVITHDEVTMLRRTTGALGLTQADYNAAQTVHRDKLSSLK